MEEAKDPTMELKINVLMNPCGVGWVWRNFVVNYNSFHWSWMRSIYIAVKIVANKPWHLIEASMIGNWWN